MAPRLSGEQLPVQQGNSIHSGRDTRGTTLGGGKKQDLTPASVTPASAFCERDMRDEYARWRQKARPDPAFHDPAFQHG